MQKFYLKFLTLFCVAQAFAQSPGDTIIVESFNYSQTYGINQWSPGIRDTVVDFPTDENISYEKILMMYNMRCKDGNVSQQATGLRDIGCGEWDASCNTYITDSTRIDSTLNFLSSHSISNFSGTSYSYSETEVFDYYRYILKEVQVDSILSETNVTIGTGTLSMDHPVNSEEYNGKAQYLYTASELISGGLSSGDINGISLNVLNVGDTSKYLRVRIKATIDTVLSAENLHLTGFSQVYFNHTEFTTGSNRLAFYLPFGWDGTSNLIVETSFTNETSGITTDFEGTNGTLQQGLYSAGDQKHYFDGANYLEADTYKGISGTQSRTIEAWINSSTANKEIVSWGTDSGTQKWVFRINGDGAIRVEVNGGSIYGTNLVDDGEWHHVACVFNGTQVSDISLYVDGQLETIASTSNSNVNTHITSGINMRTSRGINNRYFKGNIDEVRVWSTALSATDIQEWMNKKLNANHPEYTNLESHYELNEGSGNAITDLSSHARNATVMNGNIWQRMNGVDLFKEFTTTTERPNITFHQGIYNLDITNDTVFDAIGKMPNYVIEKSIIAQPGILKNDSIHFVSENYFWESGDYERYYDESGTVYDSVMIDADAVITPTELSYYKRFPSKYEIMSFVTPYGLGLDLGIDGKTWTFDVTDYAPILNGSKRITIERGGQWMEDMDIKFMFIVGTPPRDIIDIQQMWKPDGSSASYTNIIADRVFEPRDFLMNAAASAFKIRSTITGHGQEGEFIPREHFLDLNNGDEIYSWMVWKACAENPIYPQGGTWIYDRAGWCPGMASDIEEYDITEFVTPGASTTIDYGVISGSGSSKYVVNNQLVSYGAINHNLDASVLDVTGPSSKVEYSRTNSMCSEPTVLIQNTGSTDLSSLTIEYWVNNTNTRESFEWTGNLEFLESEEVTLPIGDIWEPVTSTGNVFHVEVKSPNGSTDEYVQNNVYNSPFTIPDVVPANFYVRFRTNSFASESRYELLDWSGNSLFVRNGMSNNTTYKDTFNLGLGCYSLVITDSDGDGINFWANNDGTGSARISEVGGSTIKSFNGDFGGSLTYNFTIDYPLKYEDINPTSNVEIFPNPANDQIFISGKNLQLKDLEIYNSIGQKIELEINSQSKDQVQVNVSKLPPGIYMIHLNNDGLLHTEKLIIQ